MKYLGIRADSFATSLLDRKEEREEGMESGLKKHRTRLFPIFL